MLEISIKTTITDMVATVRENNMKPFCAKALFAVSKYLS